MLETARQPGLGSACVAAIRAAGVTFISGVPDSGLGHITAELNRTGFDGRYVPGTREDNCVALAVGAHLAGETSLVFMKSAGLGTSVDALTSLAKVYEIPLVVLVSWAGYAGRDIPHHNAIGTVLQPVLHALGLPTREARLTDPAALQAELTELVAEARRARTPAALLGIPAGL